MHWPQLASIEMKDTDKHNDGGGRHSRRLRPAVVGFLLIMAASIAALIVFSLDVEPTVARMIWAAIAVNTMFTVVMVGALFVPCATAMNKMLKFTRNGDMLDLSEALESLKEVTLPNIKKLGTVAVNHNVRLDILDLFSVLVMSRLSEANIPQPVPYERLIAAIEGGPEEVAKLRKELVELLKKGGEA